MTVRAVGMTHRGRAGGSRRARARTLAALALVGALALAGCTGDEDGGDDDGDVSTRSAQVDDADGTGGQAAPARPTKAMKIQAVPGRRSASSDGSTVTVEGDRAAFVSPAGILACVVTDQTAMCQVSGRTYTPPPDHLLSSLKGECAPEDATAIVLATEQGAWVCPPTKLVRSAAVGQGGWWAEEVDGETEKVNKVTSAVLPYGMTLRVGQISCSSAEAGITCRDGGTGDQFLVARTTYSYS